MILRSERGRTKKSMFSRLSPGRWSRLCSAAVYLFIAELGSAHQSEALKEPWGKSGRHWQELGLGDCFNVIGREAWRSRTNEKCWKDFGKPRAPIRDVGAIVPIGLSPVSVSLSQKFHMSSLRTMLWIDKFGTWLIWYR